MLRRVVRIVVLSLAGLALGVLFYRLRSLFTPFWIAALIAYLIHPLVRNLVKRGVKRDLAIWTVYAAGLILAAIFLIFFIPTLFQEARSLGHIIPVLSRTWSEVQQYMDRLSRAVQLPGTVREILSEMFKHVRGVLVHNARDFAGELLGVVGLIPSLILAPFLAYYMIKDFDHFKRRFLATLPPAYRRDVLHFLHEADLLFSKFLRGDLSISLLVGIFTGIGAALIGMKYYLIVGIITALADLVPIFGPVLAAIPVVGLALAESRLKGALMLAVFLLVQELESSILTPRLLGDRMGMHPLVIILVLLVGGYLYGALGMIFSVPVAGLLRVAWRFMWARVL